MLNPLQFAEFDPTNTSSLSLNVENIQKKYDASDRIPRDPETGRPRAVKPLTPWMWRRKTTPN